MSKRQSGHTPLAPAPAAPFPARTTVYVTLPPGMLVEIDALAVLSEASPSA